MYIVAVLNESNFYEQGVDILENPVEFKDFEEAIRFAKPLIEQNYDVVIRYESNN